MAWSTPGACNNSNLTSTASLDYMLMKDEALHSTNHMLKESTLRHQFPLHHGGLRQYSPHTFFPFSLRDVGDVDNTFAASCTASICGNIMQGQEAMKRPLFWPFLDMEKVKGSLSPDQNAVNEQSGSTSEFCNVSSTAMMERMLRSSEQSNEEVEMNINEGESTIRKKKRLTGEQLRLLESSFETDKKLEAERKQELAQHLGLEPRQVAVWFQNRRARSKTKHLEHDFALLKSKYHSVLAETHKLRSEVSRLTAELTATKSEAGGARRRSSFDQVQLAPMTAPLQNSGSNQYSPNNVIDKSSIIVMEAAYSTHDRSNLLSKNEGDYIFFNSMNQSVSASPSMSCSPANSSHDNEVEGKSSDYNTSSACIREENQQNIDQGPCSELVACLLTDQATTARFEHVDTNCYTQAANYLKKVNAALSGDTHKLQASQHYIISSEDIGLQGSSSHQQVAFDCLWEVTT